MMMMVVVAMPVVDRVVVDTSHLAARVAVPHDVYPTVVNPSTIVLDEIQKGGSILA